VAAAAAVALAQEAGGVITDLTESWVAASDGSATHLPSEFLTALRSKRNYASISDGATALLGRCPGKRPRPATTR
jgi:hypothetical protein